MSLEIGVFLTAILIGVIVLYRRLDREKGVNISLYLKLQAEENEERYFFWKVIALPIVPRIGDTISIADINDEESFAETNVVAKIFLMQGAIAQVTCEEISVPKEALSDYAETLIKAGWSKRSHLKTKEQYAEKYRKEREAIKRPLEAKDRPHNDSCT